ncbi:MAG: MFS transporter [Armatimonadetes bacterium]|nr:MFS transporter [Armatimonadota bacterium]
MPYYRRNLYILSATIFLTALSWNQVMPFLPLFMQEMGLDKRSLLHWVGIVFALQSSASIVTMPFWGKLGDKYGRKPMAIRAGLCLGAIYYAMTLCQTPLQLAVLRFLNGALTGFVPMSMALIATNTPQDEAPRYIATAQSCSAAGLIVGPAVGGVMAALFGYTGTMWISGTAVLASTLLVALLVKEPNKHEITEQTSLLRDFAISLRSKVLSSIMLTVMVFGIFTAAINPILALHLASLGGKNAPVWLSGVIFSLPPAALMLTAHFWARFGERRGFDRGIQIGMTGSAAAALMLAFTRDIWAFAAVFFVAGIFIAAIGPSTGALICTRVHEEFRGRAYGMQQSATMVGTLIAPLAAAGIGGALGLWSVFAFVGVVSAVGAAVFPMLVRQWHTEPVAARPSEASEVHRPPA